jgi:hypothetical protein
MRHIIIHYHIYKNAGMTIDSILLNNFGGACGRVEGTNLGDTLEAKDILKYAIDNPSLKVISSHEARLPEPKTANITFHPLIFLRHPIDRVGSAYSFERWQASVEPRYALNMAYQTDLSNYVRWKLTDGVDPTVRNFQTIHLSGRERDMRTAVANKLDLERVLERIEVLEFFGIVELFQDSMLRMESYLARQFGNIDTSFSVENKSQDRKETFDERIDELKTTLGPSLYGELLEKNSLDIELYEKAKLKFVDSRRHSVPAQMA